MTGSGERRPDIVSGERRPDIVAVRHGESTANVAYGAAVAAGLPVTLPGRDADVPLSPLGRRQAAALGRRLARYRPDAVWCSPYLRARETWEIAAGHLDGPPPPVRTDDRLGDRRTGILELMTPAAVERTHPLEARRRAAEGEYAYRPPGGESFGDMADRLRQVADVLGAGDDRVLVVAHDAVVALLRFLLAGGESPDVARIAGYQPVPNASVSSWVRGAGHPRLTQYGDVSHL
ncbi:phosphoglycerate mutase [Microtetraspora sp. NBRC 13810]|uniref:histidine phosphatase family protein n=1 Tax=Microtetraspora sp. NBRC 13810 TaxID=3030990 RepID=UPI0024A38CF8|nr:histidine phosphatase family protein [Microtetraspora sp. NBRC 13810]GLW12564.1 phosphoglycerate mutase [Microtetraspora sp. NBRC 13810]